VQPTRKRHSAHATLTTKRLIGISIARTFREVRAAVVESADDASGRVNVVGQHEVPIPTSLRDSICSLDQRLASSAFTSSIGTIAASDFTLASDDDSAGESDPPSPYLAPYSMLSARSAPPALQPQPTAGDDAPNIASRSDVVHLIEIREELTELVAAIIGELFLRADASPDEVLLAAIDEPGVRSCDQSGRSHFHSLVDAARLAVWTGHNVLDGFAGDDLACGGIGGPMTGLAEWRLLASPHRRRVVVHLGETLRMTYLPTATSSDADRHVVSFDVGPGTALLDRLVRYLTGDRRVMDDGGRLAVQGRLLHPLVGRWLSAPFFERGIPRYLPRGAPVDPFLAAAKAELAKSPQGEQAATARDILYSANHFLAQTIGMAAGRFLPREQPPEEMVVVGGGRHNGLLLGELRRRLPLRVRSIEPFELDDSSLPPALASVLGLMYLDRRPTNSTALTAADVSRVLGRLTAGRLANWDLLLQSGFSAVSVPRSLRSVVGNGLP